MPEPGNERTRYYVLVDANIRTGDEDSLFLKQKRDATTQATNEDFLLLDGKRDKSTQTNDEDFILLAKAKDAETQTSEEDFELCKQINSGGFASSVALKTLLKNKRKITSGGSDVNKRSRTEVGEMSKVISTSSDTVPISSDSNMDISASSGQTGMEESHSTGINHEYLNIEESYHHDENIQIPSYLVNKRSLNTIENDALSKNPFQKENAADIITDSELKVKSVFLVAGVDASFTDIFQSKLCAEKLKNGPPLNLETIEMKQKCYKFKNMNFPPSYFATTRKIYCDVCKVCYSDAGSHDSNQTCDVCKKIFECKKQLEDHYLIHEEFHATNCRICHSEIDKHEIIKERREYQCCECGFRFGCKANLQLHLYIHSPLKLFKCEYCGKRFKLTIYVRNHFKNLHPACELCGKRFVNNNSLDTHRLEEHS